MLILRLQGGLGNILFQYALARHLSLKNGLELKYDVRSYLTNPLGDYSFSLEAFQIDIKNRLASPEEIARAEHYRWKPGKFWVWYNRLIADRKRYVDERQFHFEPWILTVKDPMYLTGWWQTEKYFVESRQALLEDLRVRQPLTGKNKEVAERMAGVDAVSVHIRRLDYVNNPKTKEYHGELTQEYYDRALAKIAETVANPVLFVFSDDVAWVKEHMSFPYEAVYIDWNGPEPHEDIRLMSLCKHNIIANSTLGWWGAWLNDHPGKIVVAPQRWFANAPKCDTRDIIPEGWVKL